VSLGPVRRFLAGGSVLPILGDDPRDRTRQKVFSVAPLERSTSDTDSTGGYLYVVLASEEYDSAADMLRDSYILRLSLGIAASGLLVALGGGLGAFAFLTRRLRALSASIDEFRRRRLKGGPLAAQGSPAAAGDEIDALAASFEGMAKRIDEQMQELESKDALRRELVANVSHDLRTPLTTLHGYLETLSLKEETLSAADRARYLEAALRHSQRLGRLIDELFELAKMDAGEMRPHPEAFSMSELAQDVVQEFRLRAAERGVRLEVSPATDLPFVEADIGMMERVLENLVENALRHTPESGRVSVRLVPEGRLLHVEVEDTGCGIAPDELPRIFERFYRVASGASDTGGSGLGLAISKRMLDLHECPLEARSTLGQGTTFAFGLPVAGSSPSPAGSGEAGPGSPASPSIGTGGPGS
jgi:signal transduction histidine kinase